MELIIDFNFLSWWYLLIDLGNHPPIVITWIIFKNGGWFFVLWAILEGLWDTWMHHIQDDVYAASIDYVLLAFTIPKESETNQQSPKAVEHIFSQLMGAYSSVNLIEKYWKGKVQPKFSLEIISIEGYIQFLIRTPVMFRNLVESAFYAQYPEAEISEVADYAKNISIKFPSEEYDLRGSEIILAKDAIYPIKTYPNFEHPLTKELKDPMASLLETLSRFQKGEQLWLQIVITPDLNAVESLQKKGLKTINKMAGIEEKTKEHLSDKGINLFMKTLDSIGEAIYPLWKLDAKPKKDKIPSLMQHLTSGEKAIIEAIEEKISKVGFLTKIRFIYIAKKEVFDSKKGTNAIFGVFYQFLALNLNRMKSNSKTMIKTLYFFNQTRRNFRKNRLLRYYKCRERSGGSALYILNIEELATLYHFPILSIVKTPSIQKTKSKTAEPPFSLPTGDENVNLRQTFRYIAPPTPVSSKKTEKTPPPINLPTNLPPDNLPTK